MFNLWLVAQYLPPLNRQGRTILTPKVQSPRPDQKRPITITSHLVRLLHRTLASRIGRVCTALQRQKAFTAVDGCAENLAILGMLVHNAHSLKSDVCMALLGMAKAFDSVSWFTLDRCMQRAGIPSIMRRYIMSSLEGSTTSLSTDGKACGEVKLQRGVKQGDPLSPLLFNLVIDELVAELENSPSGVTVTGQRVSCLAFADDLVLVATTTDGLQQLIRRTEETLKNSGLLMNPEKCRSMVLKVDREAKKWYDNSEATFVVDGKTTPQLQPGDAAKYLGVLVGPDGRRESYVCHLEKGLKELRVPPLKPQQRVFILGQHLVPSLLHKLVLGKVYRTQLARLDRTIRCFVRASVKMPGDAANALLYSDVPRSGLGIPHLSSLVPLMKQKRLESLLNSSDPLVRISTMEGE